MNKAEPTKQNEATLGPGTKKVPDLSDVNHVKHELEHLLGKHFKDYEFSGEQLEKIKEDVVQSYYLDTISDVIAAHTAKRTLGTFKSRLWWLDKVVGAVVQAAVTGVIAGGAYAVYRQQRQPLFNRKSAVGKSPFSSTDPVASGPRSLRASRPTSENALTAS